MLARLLLTLLMLSLAVPAAAMPACHVAMPEPMAVMHQDHGVPTKVPDRQAAPDACLGCIAPATLGTPRLATPLPFVVLRLAIAVLTGTPRVHGPPATPPPRSTA